MTLNEFIGRQVKINNAMTDIVEALKDDVLGQEEINTLIIKRLVGIERAMKEITDLLGYHNMTN